MHPSLDLAQQAQKLSTGLEALDKVSKDADGLLERLEAQLHKLNKLNAPIFDRATTLTWAEQNIGTAKAATDELLQFLGTSKKVEAVLRHGPGRDLDTFLRAISQLDAAMAYLESYSQLASAQEAYAHAEKVHQKAMRDCEADFAATLGQQTNATLPSTTTLTQLAADGALQAAAHDGPPLDQFAPRALDRLKALVDVMLHSRHMACLDVYAQVRARALDQVLRGVGFEPLGAAAAAGGLGSLSQEHLEKLVAGWTLQLRVLVVLAAAEKRLASALLPVAVVDSCVSNVLGRVLRLMVQQGRDIVEARRVPQKVFVLLDMNRHMGEVLPLLEGLLGHGKDAAAQHLSELTALHAALAKAARTIFLEWEAGIARDASKAHVVDGTVHPLAAATLSYLRRLFSYPDVGQVLFSNAAKGGAMARLAASAEEAMADAVARCMGSLLEALEVKARAYKSPAQASLFLMNNVHYMVVTVEQSERLALLGHDWVEHHKDIIEKYGQQYHATVWMPLVKTLERIEKGEDAEPLDPSKWKEWVKKHFKALNHALEGIYKDQSGWAVPDGRLRAAVRRVILQDFLPPYEHFWNSYARTDFTSNRSKYVRLSPRDVEAMVSHDLFEGRPMSISLAKAKGGVGLGSAGGTQAITPGSSSVVGARTDRPSPTRPRGHTRMPSAGDGSERTTPTPTRSRAR